MNTTVTESYFDNDKRVNGILKRFKKGKITLGKAHSLILRNDKVIDSGLMWAIIQTIMPKENE